MNILHVSPSFYPAFFFGGPIYSLYGLCASMSRSPGVDLQVLTTDTAGPRRSDNLNVTDTPVRFDDGFVVHYCHRIAGVSIAPALAGKLRALIGWADIVHLTGVYSFPTIPTLAFCTSRGKPLVWSPRGALQRWSGSRNVFLKAIWQRICDGLLSEQRCLLHVTSDQEREATSARLRNAPTLLIPNGVDIPHTLPSRDWRPGGQLRVLFLGRLDPKKGIENLIESLAGLPPYVSAKICGTGDEGYVDALRQLVRNLRVESRVQFEGHVDGAEKARAFFETDVCVVPSHTENFGMVVAESLAHGTPVVASTGTPWKKLDEKNAGTWVPNDPSSLLNALLRLSTQDLATMGARGRKWMIEDYSWEHVAAGMLDAYSRLIEQNRSKAS